MDGEPEHPCAGFDQQRLRMAETVPPGNVWTNRVDVAQRDAQPDLDIGGAIASTNIKLVVRRHRERARTESCMRLALYAMLLDPVSPPNFPVHRDPLFFGHKFSLCQLTGDHRQWHV